MSEFLVQQLMDFRLCDGVYRSEGIENGKPYVYRGVTAKYANRIAEELRTRYRATFGRKNYRVRVERVPGTSTIRIVALCRKGVNP